MGLEKVAAIADAEPQDHDGDERDRRDALEEFKDRPDDRVDIAQLALQFSLANTDMTTCVTGSANPDRVSQWVDWSEKPLDEGLLGEVLAILEPIHNWFYIEGRPENNDPADD